LAPTTAGAVGVCAQEDLMADEQPEPSPADRAAAAGPATGGGYVAVDADDGAEPRGPGPARRWAVRLLMAVVVVGILTSTLAVWSHRVVLDTDVWVTNAEALAADPAVTDAIADKLTTQIVDGLQLQGRLRDALPADQRFLAVPLTAGVTQLVERITREVLQSEKFQEVWSKANRIVHEKVVAFLRGETTTVQLDESGAVVLDLTPLVAAVVNKLSSVAPDVFGQGFTVPVIDVDVAPGQIRQTLQESLGVQLPPDFGRFTLFTSEDLATAQRAVTAFDRLVVVLPLLTLVLAVVMLVVSAHRLRTLLGLGVALAVSMVLVNALFQAVANQIVGLITGTAGRSAALTLTGRLLGELRGITNWILIVGLFLAVGAFLAGDSRPARAIRGQARQVARRVDTATGGDHAEPAADGGPTGAVLNWVTAHATGLRYLGVAVAFGWLALVSATWGTLVVVLVVLGLYELGLEVLVPSGQTVRARQAIEHAARSAGDTLGVKRSGDEATADN
jgi:hypothetical protein